MSSITRCPACATMFRVVPDQLRISDGWVRCGHCAEVFDATAHMQAAPRAGDLAAGAGRADAPDSARTTGQEPAPPPPPPPPLPPTAPRSVPPIHSGFDEPAQSWAMQTWPGLPVSADQLAPPAPPGAPAWPTGSDAPRPGASRPPASEALPLQRPDRSPAPATAPEPDDGGDWPAGRRVRARESADPTEFSESMDASASPRSRPGDDPADAQDDDAAPVAVDDVSFVRKARRQAFWRRRGVRAALALALLVLGAGLAAQVAYSHRERIAATWPQIRPLLEAFCDRLGCEVGAYRRIDALVIDSSAFNRVRPDVYKLSVTLRNQFATEVAMPALELTLTDLQDQPVLRRVIQAAELSPSVPAGIAAGAEWSGSVTLSIASNGAGGRVAGYRLLAFYP